MLDKVIYRLILKGLFVSGNHFSVCTDKRHSKETKKHSTPKASSQTLNILIVNSGLIHSLDTEGFAPFEYLLWS